MEKFFQHDTERQKELEAYVSKMPQIVPKTEVTDSSRSIDSGLECEDWLAVVVVSELANISLEPAWRHHDEKCNCEITTNHVESLI